VIPAVKSQWNEVRLLVRKLSPQITRRADVIDALLKEFPVIGLFKVTFFDAKGEGGSDTHNVLAANGEEAIHKARPLCLLSDQFEWKVEEVSVIGWSDEPF